MKKKPFRVKKNVIFKIIINVKHICCCIKNSIISLIISCFFFVKMKSKITIDYFTIMFYTANATISDALISMNVPRTQYNVGDFVDVEIVSTSTASGLKIRPQRCWASPTIAGTTTYDLLKNRYDLTF